MHITITATPDPRYLTFTGEAGVRKVCRRFAERLLGPLKPLPPAGSTETLEVDLAIAGK